MVSLFRPRFAKVRRPAPLDIPRPQHGHVEACLEHSPESPVDQFPCTTNARIALWSQCRPQSDLLAVQHKAPTIDPKLSKAERLRILVRQARALYLYVSGVYVGFAHLPQHWPPPLPSYVDRLGPGGFHPDGCHEPSGLPTVPVHD